VIIVAGGSGSRMGLQIPKQFVVLGDKPVLMHTIQAFYNADISNIILVIPSSHKEYWNDLREKYSFEIPHVIVPGGLFRSASVSNGLDAISEEDAVVAVHDGVRPFVSRETITRAFEIAEQDGASVPYLDISDSLRKIEGITNKPVDRDRFKTVQTPQCFRLWMLKKAYKIPQLPSFNDDATLVEMLDVPIKLFKGNQENIKITTPFDLIIAETIISKLQEA
jgi:2-C-methyl-D-erythritol 4-phosphate cytidylyltransferase